MNLRCKFEVVTVERDAVTIRDIGHGQMTVTNDAENVVAELVKSDLLPPGRRLFYYDSAGELDEMLLHNGRFAGFAPGPRATSAK